MPSDCCTRLYRWWKRQGAIRLEEEREEEERVVMEKGILPLDADAVEEASDTEEGEEGYTQARLLLECVIASIWNAFCLGYLMLFPSFDPISNEVICPRPAFLHVLLALAALPLVIGMLAGAEANWGQKEAEIRMKRSTWKNTLILLGFIGCCAGIGLLVAFVARDQNVWLQNGLFATTLLAQALLLRRYVSSDEASSQEHFPFRRDTPSTPVSTYSCSNEKVSVYEFLRETYTSSSN